MDSQGGWGRPRGLWTAANRPPWFGYPPESAPDRGCSLLGGLGGRGRLDGFDVPAVAADGEDDGDEDDGED